MRALCGDEYFGGEGEEMAFFSEHRFLFFFSAEESKINTDEPYHCVCVFEREGLDLELHTNYCDARGFYSARS